jgi:aspartate aminotransferase-like enzyme
MRALGLELFGAISPGAAVTAAKPPAGVTSTAIVKNFKEQFAGTIADGQGEMKGELFRIAHIGYLDYLDAVAVIAGLEQVLAQLWPGHFELGTGVAAAQRAYQSATALGATAPATEGARA